MSAAMRLEADERQARALDARMANADGKDFEKYLRSLKPPKT